MVAARAALTRVAGRRPRTVDPHISTKRVKRPPRGASVVEAMSLRSACGRPLAHLRWQVQWARTASCATRVGPAKLGKAY